MDRKKIIFISIGIIILVLLAVVLSLINSQRKNTPPQTQKDLSLLPDKKNIEINGETIEIANPQKIAIDSLNPEEPLLAETSDFSIFYSSYNQENAFIIILTGKNFEEARQKAESAFLEKLKITKEDACKLSVFEKVPWSVNQNISGSDFPLSFCSK